MYDRMQTLDHAALQKFHDASLAILAEVGVAFNHPGAVAIFQEHGCRVEGRKVFLAEKQVLAALATCPSRFTVAARDPAKAVAIGEDDYVLVPGYGSPFMMTPEGEQRPATLADYQDFCKLVQTSSYMAMNGFMLVEPGDVPPQTAHLDMMLAGLTFCDKPLMGTPVNQAGAREGVEMLQMVFGRELPVASVSLINSLSPLQYSEEMAGSLIELAQANQAMVVASLIMAGSSGPVTLEGVLALQNAEILAGLTLAQLIRPGVPIIYGSTSSAMDMRSGGLAVGAPELCLNVSHTAQMARFYNLPSRSGGGLTDAHIPDAQAGAESALALSTAIRNGVNFVLHACGILGSYISMSFEKFLIDEEIGGMLLQMQKPLKPTDEAIDLAMIKKVGIGGQYLTQPKTFKLCRSEFFLPSVFNRMNYMGWRQAGARDAAAAARTKLAQRLAKYQKPAMDQGLEQELTAYVARKKQG